MIPEEAPCEWCLQPHTKTFCNDGFYTEGGAYLCARYDLNNPTWRKLQDLWWYEVAKVNP